MFSVTGPDPYNSILIFSNKEVKWSLPFPILVAQMYQSL